MKATMACTGYMRGHPIVFDGVCWRWMDTGEPAADDRPCVACGRVAEPGAPDPCLGHVPGAVSACCGHGVEPPYVVTRFQQLRLRAAERALDACDAALSLAARGVLAIAERVDRALGPGSRYRGR